ncbi:RNA polymerase sigma-70 factor (sigma-E family) [Catenulispora sp. MAP12-49]|uniref:SigE family RNA polymerase sigma factor n=1 Tax=unclassified Catenulispora TaxID=414885 RepID=UPI0035152B4B
MRAADEAEFREYMAARWPALVRTAYLLTGDRHSAEDLAQTALEKAAVAWGKVRRADNADAYVRRILVNTHLARFRRKRVVEILDTETPEVPSTDSAQQIALRDELLKALATLPKRQCAVVVLRYWEDLTEAQTAAILGCSVGTVRSQAFKALAKLRVSPLLRESDPLSFDMSEEGRA